MSENLSLLQETISLYNNAKLVPNTVEGGIWDDLLSLIEGVIKKVLNTVIGANGKTINDIINDVKDKISNIVTDIKSTVNGITNTLTNTIGNAITLIDNFISGLVSTLSRKVDDVITEISKTVDKVVSGVTAKIDEILGGIGDAISKAIQSVITKIEGIIDGIRNIGSQIAQGISNAINNIGNFISNAVNDAIATVTAIIASVIDSVKNWLVTAYNNIKTAIEGVVKSVSDWVTGIYNGIKEWFNQTIQHLKDTYESVKESVIQWIDKALSWFEGVKKNVSDWFWTTVTKIAGWIKTSVIPKFDDAITGAQTLMSLVGKAWEFISSGNYQGAFDLLDNFAKGLGIPAPVGTIHALLSTIAYFWQTINLQFIPAQIAASKNAEIKLALGPISNNDAAVAVFKGYWSESDYLANATLAGQSKARAKAAFEATKNIPSPGQTQQLFLRGEIGENEHDHILSSYGFSDTHIKEIKALYAVIPSITDIITMAVKEAFTPDIAKRFGQYDDLPEAFITWAKKQGLSEEWASRYWAAHWDLPSPQMGFTMYQRGIIEKDDLKLLLKALDVMPFWREKLISLSYNPPTRVDVRRMYKMGVINEDQVYRFMLDIGYSPNNAKLLTEFTKKYSAPEDESEQDKFTDLARGTYSSAYKEHIISQDEYRAFMQGLKYANDDIDLLISIDDYAILQKDKLFDNLSYRKDYLKLVTQGYNRGLFNRTDAKPLLLDLGYSEDQAELELSLIDYSRQLTIKDSLLNQLHNQYVGFMIDDVDLHTILDTFSFYADEIDRLIEEWGIERSFRDKRPSITDIKSFYTKGLITLDDMLNELRGIGYNERYIGLYQKVLAKG